MRSRPAVPFAFVVALSIFTVTAVVRTQQPATAPALSVPVNRAPHPAPEQPLPFSHKTHISRGVRCQTCHTNPEPGAQMTFPASTTCMGCHTTVAKDRPAIVKLAEMARSSAPIPWRRVYQVLPGVTWTHRTHLQAGLQCAQCHGNVGELDAMAEETGVTAMASCVTCHQAQKASTACITCHGWPVT
jgi:hypothetical protein